jgi:plasmid stabilization system protein ParE
MKKVKVIWTDESLNDLETIYDFIAEQSSKSAKKVIQSILSRTRQ